MTLNLRLMPYKDSEKQKAAQARYFQENKEKLGRSRTQRRSLFRRKIQEIKEASPCADCGEKFPHYVMDFDHLPGNIKEFGIGCISKISSLEALDAEIAKCQIVCANCHRHRTFMRGTK